MSVMNIFVGLCGFLVGCVVTTFVHFKFMTTIEDELRREFIGVKQAFYQALKKDVGVVEQGTDSVAKELSKLFPNWQAAAAPNSQLGQNVALDQSEAQDNVQHE